MAESRSATFPQLSKKKILSEYGIRPKTAMDYFKLELQIRWAYSIIGPN